MDGGQIVLHDSTIVPWMANKSAELITHAVHKWPIKRPRDFQPRKNQEHCLCILVLVHMYANSDSWFSALQVLYLYLPCKLDRGTILEK